MVRTGFRHWDMTARVSEHYRNRLDYSFHSLCGSTRVAWLGRLTNTLNKSAVSGLLSYGHKGSCPSGIRHGCSLHFNHFIGSSIPRPGDVRSSALEGWVPWQQLPEYISSSLNQPSPTRFCQRQYPEQRYTIL